MILEKIKQHGGKIMFFMINVLVVFAGVLLIRQKVAEQAKSSSSAVDAQNYKAATDYALEAQARIKADNETKTASIANKPDTIEKQQATESVKTIPAVTKNVTVQQPAASSTQVSSATKSSAKTTTKTS